METPQYCFFWNGYFSNWHHSPFKIDGIQFNCGEQYMMYQKAMKFGDTETAEKILQVLSPSVQKILGRKVNGYNDSEWSEVRYDIVKRGLREKFKQNPKLYDALVGEYGKIIVEASPTDRIWGIGFHEEVALDHLTEWGENLLGKILTELSTEFYNEVYSINDPDQSVQ